MNKHYYSCRCKCATIMGTKYKTEKCWLMIGTAELSFGTVPQFGLLLLMDLSPI